MFKKLPRSLLAAEYPQVLVESVHDAIAQQVEQVRYCVAPEQVATLPEPGQTVYWARYFECEVACNGFDYFILEPLGIYAQPIHAALRALEAHELVRRLEACIPLARGTECAEFTALADQSWFEQFALDPDFPTLESVNDGGFEAADQLSEFTAAYIKSNAHVLFEDE